MPPVSSAAPAPPTATRSADGAFHNPWPASEPHRLGAIVSFLRKRRRLELPPNPPRGSFATATPDVRRPHAPDNSLVVTWIGHSTALLQFGGLNVLTDPVFSQRASPVPWAGPRRVMDPGLLLADLPPIDVVLLSHNHYDHLDRPAVKRIAREHPGVTWVVAAGVGDYIRRWGAREIVELEWWQQADVKGLHLTATPARHFSGRGFRDRNKSLWCGFAFTLGKRRVLFAGDSAYHPAFTDIGARCGPFELVMMPIGAYDPRWFMGIVHMDPEQAVQAYRDVVASQAVPLPVMLAIHWGTFRLTDEPMDEPPRLTLDHWRGAGLDEQRLWIPSFGETRAI